jgi:tRNA(Ile)-lysidine synthase
MAGRDRNYCLQLKIGERCQLPFGAGFLTINRIPPESEYCANFKKDQGFVAEQVEFDAVPARGNGEWPGLAVRNWQPGDQLHRAGHAQPEKVKSLFQEERVFLWDRRHWPVMVAGEQIVWVRQFGVDAKFRAGAESTERLRIEFRTDA